MKLEYYCIQQQLELEREGARSDALARDRVATVNSIQQLVEPLRLCGRGGQCKACPAAMFWEWTEMGIEDGRTTKTGAKTGEHIIDRLQARR